MSIVAFLHQKGGTGKSTLALASALLLTGRGGRVLLVDADPQGTCSDWGNRFGRRHGVEVTGHIQPDFSDWLAPRQDDWDAVLIDGPPALSPVTESILAAAGRAIVPLRPSPPDLWAVPWFAAIVRKLQNEGHSLEARVVFNMHREEPLAPLTEELAAHGLPVAEHAVPADAAFPALFTGEPLPEGLGERVAAALEW